MTFCVILPYFKLIPPSARKEASARYMYLHLGMTFTKQSFHGSAYSITLPIQHVKCNEVAVNSYKHLYLFGQNGERFVITQDTNIGNTEEAV